MTNYTPKRIKLICVETWISKKKWFDYAIDFNEKKNDSVKIKLLEDRSPCRDPYFSHEKIYISGLCRASSVGKEKDILIYYTNPCNKFFPKTKQNNCIVLIKGMYVDREYSSHAEFILKNPVLSRSIPNIIAEKNSDNPCGYSMSLSVNPIPKEKSVCYTSRNKSYFGKEITDKIYRQQIRFYFARYIKHKLKVLECLPLKFCSPIKFGIDEYALFEKANLLENQKSILSSKVNGAIIPSPVKEKLLKLFCLDLDD